MAMPLRQMQPVLAFGANHLDEDLSLAARVRQAGAGHCGKSAGSAALVSDSIP
jgi:hypothetical protein